MISRLILLFALCSGAAFGAASKPSAAPVIQRFDPALSILRVNATNQAWDFRQPWTKKNPFARRGLGALIEGGRILVTAELVANHTYIEIEKARTAEKAAAVVERVDYDSNLAVLKPVDASFLEGMRAIPLDEDARSGDRASVIQFEPNGEVASTPATITSVTITGYPVDNMGLLTFRLSVPLQQKDGSFTVPAVRDGRLLGLLMRYDARSQVADVIPPPVIRHFLTELAKPEYGGFARAGFAFATTRDPQLRRFIGLSQPGGVYVTQVLRGGAAEKAGLRAGDVVMEVEGHPIDQDGNYEDPEFGRIAFSHITNTKSHPGDTVSFKVFRDGATVDVPVKLEARDRSKMVSESYVMDRQPRYVVLGGLVFLELSRPYLQEWGGNWSKEAPQRLVFFDAFQEELPKDRGKIVLLSEVLPTQDTLGYEDLSNLVVAKINGREIRSLEDVLEAAKVPVNGFHRIECDEDPKLIFLDAAAVERNREKLRDEYSLPALENLR